MGIIAFIILGAIAGAIAKALLPGDDPGGFIITTLVGIVGALLGGFLAAALFNADPMDEFWDLSSWLTAIVGSIILLLIYRAVAGRGERGRLSDAGPRQRPLQGLGALSIRSCGCSACAETKGSRPRGNVRTAVSAQPSSRQMYVRMRSACSSIS